MREMTYTYRFEYETVRVTLHLCVHLPDPSLQLLLLTSEDLGVRIFGRKFVRDSEASGGGSRVQSSKPESLCEVINLGFE